MKKLKEKNEQYNNLLKDFNIVKEHSIAMEVETQDLKNSYQEIKNKYESLRDVDSPIKEVSQLKTIVKDNDEKIEVLKSEKQELVIKLQKIECQPLNEPENRTILDENENENLRKALFEMKEKYESLRDIDSSVKEVSQIKKILKLNDSNLENSKLEMEELHLENQRLLKKLRESEISAISNENDRKIIEELKRRVLDLENQNFEIQEKYESLRDIDSPVNEVSTMKKLIRINDEKLISLQKDNLDSVNKIKLLEYTIEEKQREINNLNEKLRQAYEQISNLKEIDSTTIDSKKLKNKFLENEETISKLRVENVSLMEKLEKFNEIDSENKGLKLMNEELMRDFAELEEKYQALREVESPLKGVNEIKQLLKKSDERLNDYKSENLALKTHMLSLGGIQSENVALVQDYKDKTQQYNKLLKDFNALNEKSLDFEVEKEEIKKSSQEIKKKYDSLRDVDSPVKEVSQLKSILKNNDEKIEILKKEKEELLSTLKEIETNPSKEDKTSELELEIEGHKTAVLFRVEPVCDLKEMLST